MNVRSPGTRETLRSAWTAPGAGAGAAAGSGGAEPRPEPHCPIELVMSALSLFLQLHLLLQLACAATLRHPCILPPAISNTQLNCPPPAPRPPLRSPTSPQERGRNHAAHGGRQGTHSASCMPGLHLLWSRQRRPLTLLHHRLLNKQGTPAAPPRRPLGSTTSTRPRPTRTACARRTSGPPTVGARCWWRLGGSWTRSRWNGMLCGSLTQLLLLANSSALRLQRLPWSARRIERPWIQRASERDFVCSASNFVSDGGSAFSSLRFKRARFC